MTREEFLDIFNNYFKGAKHYRHTNPKALFCAYCDYIKYKKTTPRGLTLKQWWQENNIPSFGYDAKTKPQSSATYFWDKLYILCRGEDFLEFVPSWKEMVEAPKLEIVPPEKKDTSFSEFMAQMMLNMREIKLLLGDLIKTEKNHRALAGATYEVIKKLQEVKNG